MTTEQYRDAVKFNLDLQDSNTNYDDAIEATAADAVKKLWPRCGVPVDVQELAITDNKNGQCWIDLQSNSLTTKLDGVRLIEVAGSDGIEYPAEDIFEHGTKVRVRGLQGSVSKAFIYGLNKITVSGSEINIPSELEQGLVYYGVAQWYHSIVGNKRKFNEYMENGVSTVDEFLTLARNYEELAKDHIEEYASRYGRQ